MAPIPMRRALILLLLLPILPLRAEEPDAQWRDALTRANHAHKPIVVFYTTPSCARCDDFESATVLHPGIQRRLPAVVFLTMPAEGDPSIALFDSRGILRARWPIIPDATDFGIILDSVSTVAAEFERGARLAEANQADAAELPVANALARLGFVADARASLARARAS